MAEFPLDTSAQCYGTAPKLTVRYSYGRRCCGIRRSLFEHDNREADDLQPGARSVEYQDMPVIRSIVRDADKDNDKFLSILMGIIKSEPFQMRTKEVAEVESRP